MAQLVKTVKGLAIADVKTINGLAIADVKTINGLDNTSAGGQAFSDDFNRADSDSLGANWTEIAGDIDIASNKASAPQTFDNTMRAAIYDATQLDTVTQYAKITVDGGGGTGFGAGTILRHVLSGELYLISFDADDDLVRWDYFPTAGGTAVSVETKALTISYPFTAGVIVSGTGDDTEIRVWDSPTNDTPTDASNWDSGSDPADVTLDANPVTAADSGKYVGIGTHFTPGAASTWDNLFAGDA